MIRFADRGNPLDSIYRGWNICEKKVQGFIEPHGDIYYLCKAVLTYDIQKLLLSLPFLYPVGYLHSAPLYIATVKVPSYQDMSISVWHDPTQWDIEFLKIIIINLVRGSIEWTKIQCPTANYIQLTPNNDLVI